MAILQREIAALYRRHKTKTCLLPLAALPMQYADFAAWQCHWLAGPQWQRQLGYWQQQLAGAPTLLELPTDHARPAAQSYRGARMRFALPHRLAGRLHALGRRRMARRCS